MSFLGFDSPQQLVDVLPGRIFSVCCAFQAVFIMSALRNKILLRKTIYKISKGPVAYGLLVVSVVGVFINDISLWALFLFAAYMLSSPYRKDASLSENAEEGKRD